MNEPYRLRYANQMVGGFLLVLFVSTIAIGIALANASQLLVKPVYYFVNLNEDESSALQVGTEVIQLGKRIGQVDALEYAESDGMITVKLAIDPNHSSNITTGTELSLERKFGLGAAFLKVRRIKVESGKAEPLASGSVIKNFHGEIDPVKKMSDELSEVADSVKSVEGEMSPAFNEIGQAGKGIKESFRDSVNPAFDQAQTAFRSVENTSESFRIKAMDTLTQLDATTKDLDAKISGLVERAKKSADAATTASESVAKTSTSINSKTDKLNSEISETLTFMRDAITSMQRLSDETRDLVQVLRGEAEEIPGTTKQVRNTVEDTEQLVNEIRSHWLLRGARQDAAPTEQISPSSVRMQAAPR